jgi:hypothetical protein
MAQAVLTALGVILGAVIAGAVSLWRERVVTAREHEARQAEREEVRKAVREAFQREAVLALQDAIEDMWTVYLRSQSEKREAESQQGEWIRRTGTDHPPGFAEASRRIYGLSARVFDDELRDLANNTRVELGLALFAESERLERHNSKTANDLLFRMHDRTRFLLKQYFF